MKKGFTLIELLAVIVLLAIIALIAIPIVLNVITDTKTNSNKISISNYARSIELSVNEYRLKNNDILKDSTTLFPKWVEDNVEVDGNKITCEKIDYDEGVILKGCKIKGVNDTFCYREGKTYINEECTNSLLYKGTNVNLVKNGYLEYKDNTNFNGFTYEDGWLKTTINKNNMKVSTEYLKIDTSKKYEIGATIKNSSSDLSVYSGIIEYDIDKNLIAAANYLYTSNTLSTLTQDLKDGDTVVYLDNLDNWLYTQSTPAYQLGFIFWNYKDSTGYEYPELTYSRNSWGSLFTYDNVDIENNTITLTNPWDKGTIKAGTKLSQRNSGSGYNYGLLDYNPHTIEEKNYKFKIGSVCNNNGKDCVFTKFRPGTKYIRIHFGNYYYSIPATIYVKDIYIKEID